MNNQDFIPASYEQWRHFIEIRCGIRLTDDYIAERLSELNDQRNPRTAKFAAFYGQDQLKNTIAWFRRASGEPSR